MLKLELKLLKATRRTTQTNNSKAFMFLLVDTWQGTVNSPLEQSITAWNIPTEGRHQRLESSVTTKRRVMKAKTP